MIHCEQAGPKASDPAGTGLEPAGDGNMWLDGRLRRALSRAELDNFAAVMGLVDARCVRMLEDRESWYFRLHDERQPQPRGVYLKKHHVRTWRSRLGAWLRIGPRETAGRVEARNVRSLTADGIEVMKLVAYGEKLHDDGLLESFVLTEELRDYSELQVFLRRRFAPSESPRRAGRDPELNRLIRQVAGIVRKFHEAGYNHRDLYSCHFFVKEPAPGTFDIKLIDLQRVQHRRRFRRRWIVKDLAQLAWSAPCERIKCTHKLAFMRHYLGVRKLRPADKRLIREVLAKQHVMQRKFGVSP